MDTPIGSDVPESHRDLLAAPFVTLATVGPTGRPQLSTVCFLAAGNGTVQLSVNATRQKTQNIVDNPKVALHILDTTNPSCGGPARFAARVRAAVVGQLLVWGVRCPHKLGLVISLTIHVDSSTRRPPKPNSTSKPEGDLL